MTKVKEMARKKIKFTCYLEPEQLQELEVLAEAKFGGNSSLVVRKALDEFITKHTEKGE